MKDLKDNFRRRRPIQVDQDTFQDLIKLRNLYSQRSGQNVSLGWVVKHLAQEEKKLYLRSGSVYETFFKMKL